MNTTSSVALILSLLVVSCAPVDLATFNSPLDESADGNVGAWWTSHPSAPKNLFADPALAPAHGTTLSSSEVISLVSWSLPSDTLDLTPPATFTFLGNGPPRVWSGAVSLASAPVNLVGGFYDFTNVASIRFLIKTAIEPSHLAVMAQVGPKGTDQNALTLADFAPGKDLSSWTLVRVPTSLLNLNSGGKSKLHLSYWSSGGGFLNVNFLNGPSNGVAADSWASVFLISQQWTDVEFELPADVKSGTTILSQLKFTNEITAGSSTFDSVKKVIYLDNIYFH